MRSQSGPASGKRIFYGWFIAISGFFMVFTALGFGSNSRSLYLTVITEDLGVSRSLFSLGDSIRYLTTAFVNIFFGALVAKYGARRLIGFGFLSLAASMAIYAMATHVVMFYIGGCLLGLGLAWTTTTIVGHLVENWFASSKGTIMGVILAASGLGGAISSQVISRLIYMESRIAGWRISYMVTAVLMLTVGLITVLVIRNRPQDMGLTPQTIGVGGKKKVRGEQWEGISFEEARRKPYFYVALACIFVTGFVLQSNYGVASAHMRDSGIDPAAVANVWSSLSLLLMVAKMSMGFIYDRVGLRKTLLLAFGCACVGILQLAFVSSVATAYVYSVFTAFALPLETVALPLITRELFGSRSYSKIMGLVVSVNTLGYAAGVPIMNLFFDIVGSYTAIMVVMAGVMVCNAVAIQMVIGAAHKDRAAATE